MSMAIPTAPAIAPCGDYDVFLDLADSGLDAGGLARHLSQLRNRTGLVVASRRVTLSPPTALPALSQPDITVPAAVAGAALSVALAAAAARQRGLAIVRGAWLPGNEAVAALAELQGLDPMIGTIQPRFALPDDDRVLPLPGATTAGLPPLPRAALGFLPRTTLTPELPAALLYLTPRAVLAATMPPPGLPDPALAPLLVGLRRRGYRNLVANHVVVPFPLDEPEAYPVPHDPFDDGTAPAWRRDALQARGWLATLPERALESVLAGAFTSDGRARLLLDCRGMVDWHNGTTDATLGILGGFARLDPPDVEITMLATTAAAKYHDLARRFGGFALRLDQPDGSFLAAVRLDQPWSLDTIAELHERCVVALFYMLDTILWDIIYPAPDGLDRAWRALASLADGLLFDSDFTRQRFAFRFAPDPAMPLEVAYLSLAADDWSHGPVGLSPVNRPYLFVVGNSYDHKDVEPTLATLVDAFPLTPIIALGADGSGGPSVTRLPSGRIDAAEIDTLIAHAAAVVYPSHYEGFGLPVVQSLARGRTTIVRRSPLWEEIAGTSDLPGAIVPFHDEASLVDAVGRALHGLPPHGLSRGGRLGPNRTPPSWLDCAERIAALVRRLALAHDGRRWIARHTVLTSAAPGPLRR
jgi:glycosyltransferase involved in cell wall biosynthesis